MASFNQSIILGNLTRDPQLTYTPKQTAVADFGLASNHGWKDQSGQDKESVCFIDVRAFGKLAEVVCKYISKGSLVLVTGRLSYETWQHNDETRSRHRIIAVSVEFLPNGKQSKS